MKLTASSVLLAGVALFSAMSAVSADGIFQTYAKPLVVKKGRTLKVTQSFVIQNYDDLRRLSPVATDPVQAGLSTDPNFSDWNFDSVFGFQSNSNHTKKNKTDKADKWADDTGVTIRSAKIFPNTWKPKLSANITSTDDGDVAIFELPQDGLTLNREYRITYKVRVGRGIPSGDTIPLPFAFNGPNVDGDADLEVLVR
ncbi:Hypothetical protein NocV09_11700060 [Nannochloropsis oceanica]